jgi:hypothetical protein
MQYTYGGVITGNVTLTRADLGKFYRVTMATTGLITLPTLLAADKGKTIGFYMDARGSGTPGIATSGGQVIEWYGTNDYSDYLGTMFSPDNGNVVQLVATGFTGRAWAMPQFTDMYGSVKSAWYDVSGSRIPATDYLSQGSTMAVEITVSMPTNATAQLQVWGTVSADYIATAGAGTVTKTLFAVVPYVGGYRLNVTGSPTIVSWKEFR